MSKRPVTEPDRQSVRKFMDTKSNIDPRDYAALDRPEVLSLLFHPVKVPRNQGPTGSVDHDIPVADGVTVAARFHLPEEKGGANIIFFHGNGELVIDYDEVGPSFVEQGVGFIVIDYRGYGWSGGQPSVTSMIADSHKVFDYVKEQDNSRGGR